MMGSIRSWGTTAVLLTVSGIAGAVPASASELDAAAPLVITLPDQLVVSDLLPGGDPGVATVSGCPAGDLLAIAITYLTPDGEVVADDAEFPDLRVPDNGTVDFPLSTVADRLGNIERPALGSIEIGVTCSSTGETAVTTIRAVHLQIQMPASVTVQSLRSGDGGNSAMVLGCPTDDQLQVTATYHYRVGDVDNEVPIALATGLVSTNGVAEFPLAVVTRWLQDIMPARGSVLLEATCISRDGTSSFAASATIPSGELTAETPPAPDGSTADSRDQTGATVTGDPESRAHALATTGAPVAATALQAVGMILVGGTALALGFQSRRRRRV